LSVINAFVEILTLLLIFPLLDFLINGNGIYLDKLTNFFGYYSSANKNLFFFKILIIIILIKVIFNSYFVYFTQKFLRNLRITLIENLIKKYLSEDYLFFIKNNSAFLIRNIHDEVTRVINGVISMALNLFSEILIIIFIFLLFAIYNFNIALSVLSFLLILSFIYIFISKNYIQKLATIRDRFDGLFYKNLKEIFENIKIIKIHKKEDFFIKKFSQINSVSSNAQFRYNLIALSPRIFFELFLIIIIIFFLLFFSNKDKNLIYIIALYVAGAVRLIPAISKILNSLYNIRFNLVSFNNLYSDLKVYKERTLERRIPATVSKFNFFKSIRFVDVKFYHDKKRGYILDDFNIEIEKNKFIGIIGKTGSGKSTFIDLISGLIFPKSGEVVIDNNIVLNSNNIEEWKKKIGYLPQEITLLDDTIAANIAFGLDQEKIDVNKLKKSIKDSNLGDFIENLPLQENTIVGERGLKISGGERQRIGLARVLYHTSDILLLDEFTSSLDYSTELNILNIISKIPNKTKILITHREENLKFCDKVFEIKYIAGNLISSIKPSHGFVGVETNVDVYGLGFPDDTDYRCLFGNTSVVARWLSQTNLQCN
jgi:ABC-type multidrug transport system fused ATPase/permease subunit